MKTLIVLILFTMAFSTSGALRKELLVKVKDDKTDLIKSNTFNGHKIIRVSKLSFGTYLLLQINKSDDLKVIVTSLEDDERVEYAEPNYLVKKTDVVEVTDQKFKVQWGLRNTGRNEPYLSRQGVKGADISAIKAWELEEGSRDVLVAVIDSGVDYNHIDLKDNIWVNLLEKNGTHGVDDDGNGYIDDIHGYDFINNDGDPMDDDDTSHGTHCAGTIGASHNGVGTVGVNKHVSIVAIKFLGVDGVGTKENSIRAIDYAIKQNVDVISTSWGGTDYSKAQEDAIKRAKDRGIVFVAAAGNQGADLEKKKFYPVCYDVSNILAVGAHSAQDIIAPFSNYSKKIVDLVAPGMSIMSTIRGGYEAMSGTSMASPYVAGAIALMYSRTGRLPLFEVIKRVRETTIPNAKYRKFVISGGRLNLYNLLMDIRPFRDNPDENAWVDYKLKKPFETRHPYRNNQDLMRSYKIEGAKYIRVVVDKYKTEGTFDYLSILGGDNEEIDRVFRSGDNYTSDFYKGDSISLHFISDMNDRFWGVKVLKLQYIP